MDALSRLSLVKLLSGIRISTFLLITLYRTTTLSLPSSTCKFSRVQSGCPSSFRCGNEARTRARSQPRTVPISRLTPRALACLWMAVATLARSTSLKSPLFATEAAIFSCRSRASNAPSICAMIKSIAWSRSPRTASVLLSFVSFSRDARVTAPLPDVRCCLKLSHFCSHRPSVYLPEPSDHASHAANQSGSPSP